MYSIIVRREPSHGHTLAYVENLTKFKYAVFEICEQTDRQTYRNADRNTLHHHLSEVQTEYTRHLAAKQYTSAGAYGVAT